MKVFTVAEMVAAEKAADAGGVTYAQMMEAAGKGVAQAIIERWPVAGKAITVLVGPGNNGGDGLVAGRYLAEAGADVTFYLSKARDPEQDPNLAKIQAMGLFALVAEFDQRYRVLRTRLNITDIVVDALLGTGVSRPISGELAALTRQVAAGLEERAQILAAKSRSSLVSIAKVGNSAELGGTQETQNPKSNRPIVVAVDCPSGLNADTGELDPAAIPADLTVTFAGPKRGHFRFPGAAACGELVVADIGVAADLPAVKDVAVELITAEEARVMLPKRPAGGHKGTFGSVLVAAGSGRYWGAPVLAARAAYRAGAGLVALAVPAVIRPAVAVQLPEATYPKIEEETQGREDAKGAREEEILGEEAARVLGGQMGQYKAVLVGPGLAEAGNFLKGLLAADSLPPLVIDADGLNILARWGEWWKKLPADTILTPHPGEMARLTGMALIEMKELDRVALAREKAAEWNCIVLLKGAYTVIAAADGRCTLLPFANPLIAVAGSGDVLGGVIAALLAQGMGSYEAAVLGGYWHGAAGELAAETMGDAGLLAHELADWLPAARQRLLA